MTKIYCEICNKNKIYKDNLCKQHFNYIKTKEIIKNTNTNQWELSPYVDMYENGIIQWKLKNEVCLICENKSYNGNFFCKDCWNEMNKRCERLKYETNEKDSLFENFYIQLKKIKKEKLNNINKLIGIYTLAEKYNELFDSNALTKDFILTLKNIKKINIIENIQNKTSNDSTEFVEENNDLDYRLNFPMKFRCLDGHYVRSPFEQQIDDFLTEQNIQHYYEKRIKNYETNETYFPDWYLPNITTKGIYIEFFGINEQKYKDKTERKLKFYEKENLNIIPLYQKHIENYREYIIDKIEEFKKLNE